MLEFGYGRLQPAAPTKATKSVIAMADRNSITADYLRSILNYAPDTGVFTWQRRPGARKEFNSRYSGQQAGCVRRSGVRLFYRQIKISGVAYLAHRLAWLYMTGEWPKDEIDHKDNDGLNNKWSNLRAATRGQNSANSRSHTKLKGVNQIGNRFRAYIRHNGKTHYLGVYATAEEANDAYFEKAKEIHGEFARQ